ncbi:MAG TPA: hypothetical protein VE778_06150 [Candidatus Bathyarchaeia archaeon]|nr:hypothetical protein [Candidatus Bathyarchaeia archaeon]
MDNSYRRTPGAAPIAAAPVQQIAAPKPRLADAVAKYILAGKAFVKEASETGEDVGTIANSLPESFGAFRFVLAGAVSGYRASRGQR